MVDTGRDALHRRLGRLAGPRRLLTPEGSSVPAGRFSPHARRPEALPALATADTDTMTGTAPAPANVYTSCQVSNASKGITKHLHW
ncbi:hypothetical protein Scani_35590 [Streptomyces caniferus]|uniref:Uncharacterized protein n=1 Tax=Streptomyces caniferus TaxID=285557 RepID=A0A640SA18_9ACTN|nr:hypothetical protein Scani_35590 [Streptomyces caniferus]